ncbi:hypothetical protein K493DRAFT_305224 [Basidiobolus meristosporus CBS 931.73]|uniref:Uncharacterized protein n=1 Tax=Basidiobolus meristosporus CBS 931.73 TaxID=1314790 RepID=A0A1Y1XWC3_9FUNG|nr:hypothetical protein K493DRAFT_305224 [Basidiobolus meristosporus CBS 931.73]|eukprot:ORX90049.1 hypothetical protein K493DRAFT_305224 [Basidiobolus meristosporus CBS 931.73]
MVTASPLLCLLLANTLNLVRGQGLVEPVVFPAQFEKRSDSFFKDSRIRANIIKEIVQAENDLRIKNTDLIPSELLRDKNQLNYIASLSVNNKEAYKSDEWQENYDTNQEGCRIYGQFRKQVQKCSNYFIEKNLFRDNTRNAGFRYAYACINTREIPCPRSGCRYDPTKPIYTSSSNPIFVKEANIMKPDGKGVEEDIRFADDQNEIILFPRTRTMTLRECHSRQIYFGTQVMINGRKKDGYFAQSENAESRTGYGGDTEVRVGRAWFVFLS